MKINALNIDPDQGVNDRDETFGFIDDPADDDLTGWFFTWPGPALADITQDEANAIVDTLELDETAPSSAQSVPYSAAVEALQQYLDQYTQAPSDAPECGLTYEVIGNPRIESEYSDEYETTMVVDLRRSDGETGDVWIVAGVPDYLRGTADTCGSQHGLVDVRVFGDSPDMWCPESFAGDDYASIADAILAACDSVARAAHTGRQ